MPYDIAYRGLVDHIMKLNEIRPTAYELDFTHTNRQTKREKSTEYIQFFDHEYLEGAVSKK